MRDTGQSPEACCITQPTVSFGDVRDPGEGSGSHAGPSLLPSLLPLVSHHAAGAPYAEIAQDLIVIS